MQPAQYLNVRELFDDRFFVIPDYQRGYSWGEENVKDLLNDIERTRRRSLVHYTGTIVAKWDKNASVFEVVDGQQRLTTILLLMTRLAEVLPEKSGDIRHRYVHRGGAGNERLVVTPNAEIFDYFQKRVLDNEPNEPKQVAGHHAIDTAIGAVDEWLREHTVQAADLFSTIEEQLRFLLFVPPSDQEAGAMFEVINNRGVGLSQLQMVKNYLLYFATIHNKRTLRERINAVWQNLLHSLDSAGIDSADSEDQFLRNCYLVYFETNKSRSWDAYAQIKDRYPVDTTDVAETTQEFNNFVLFLEKAGRFVAALRNGAIARDSFPSSDVRRELKRLRCHPSLASFLPMIISVLARVRDPKKLARILSLIERVNFRVYLLPKVTNRSDSGQGQLFSWAFEFYNGQMTLSELEKALTSWAQSHSNVKTVAEHLTLDDGETEDYYSWPALRYFLARYEEFTEEQNSDYFDIEQILERRDDALSGRYLSVEHIWAQNNRADSYPADYVTKRRLGNLVLLALNENIRASDADIADKIEKLIVHAKRGVKLDQVFELRVVVEQAMKHPAFLKYKNRVDSMYAVLAQAIADIRENSFVRFAIEAWALPGDDPNQFLSVDSLSDPKRVAVCWFVDD